MLWSASSWRRAQDRDVAGIPTGSGAASLAGRGSLLPASQTSGLPTCPHHPGEINPEPVPLPREEVAVEAIKEVQIDRQSSYRPLKL